MIARDLSMGRTAAGARLAARAPWIAALLVLATLLATSHGDAPVGVFYDDAIYVDLARAIVTGAGYHHLALPGHPPGVHYPPLFPAWLVAWSWLQPPLPALDVLRWLKLGNLLLTAAAVVPWSAWGMRRLALPAPIAALAVAASLLLVPARAVSSTLLSEPLTWLLLGTALLALDSRAHDEATGARAAADAAPVATPPLPIAGVALAALLPLLRTLLLPFAIAAAISAARDRLATRSRRTMLATLALLPTILWMLWTAHAARELPVAWRGSYGAYGAMWLASWSSIADLARLLWHQVLSLWHVSAAVWTAPGTLPALSCCAAGLWMLRRPRGVAFLGTVGYLGIVVLWPFAPDRFLWGLLPLIALVLAGGAARARVLLRRRPIALAGAALALALPLASCTRLNALGYRADGWLVPQWHEAGRYGPAVAFARSLPRDAVVVTANDPLLALATGRQAVPALPPDPAGERGGAAVAPDRRLERSACVAGAGWIVIADSLDDVGRAVRVLAADPAARLHVGARSLLADGGEGFAFHCAGRAR